MTANPDQDFVLKTIKSRDVHFVRFWFTDVLGAMKSFAVVPGELEDALADGMGFDGSCIEGFCRTQESDMLAYPDASTFQVLPWRPESNAVARMFCDVRTPDGLPFEGDPRHVLALSLIHISIVPNPNVGGAGGFARGMLEALAGGATHVLLMDDDVHVSPESFKRTYNLLSLVKNCYKQAFLNGAMLSLEEPNLQYCLLYTSRCV